MPDKFLEAARLYLPSYLAPKSKEELSSGLSKYPDIDYFYAGGPSQYLQGDALFGCTATNFDTGEKKKIAAILVSNSCDINPENSPPEDRLVLFAPLIQLTKLIDLWRQRGRDDEKISNTIKDIKAQRMTYTFYVPRSAGFPESVAFLDQMMAEPIRSFLEGSKKQLFRLSNQGFYVFIVKLSVHFMRLWENVDRS